jgi:hypothetical protein
MPPRQSKRLAALTDGYRLDQNGRSNLAEIGRVWLNNAEYAERHLEDLREGLMRSD